MPTIAIAYCVLSGALAVLMVLALIGSYLDIKRFNQGVCRHCGGVMKRFDTNSQGGTGWKCQSCTRSIWTSWFKPEKLEQRRAKDVTYHVFFQHRRGPGRTKVVLDKPIRSGRDVQFVEDLIKEHMGLDELVVAYWIRLDND